MARNNQCPIDISLLEDHKEPRDKHYFAYIGFLNDAKNAIAKLRRKRKIDPNDIRIRLEEIRVILDQQKANIPNESRHTESFQAYVANKLTRQDILRILKRFDAPVSWEHPLTGYILTGAVIRPWLLYWVLLRRDHILLELYPGIAASYLKGDKLRGDKGIFSRIHSQMKNLFGAEKQNRKKIGLKYDHRKITLIVYPGTTVNEMRIMIGKISRLQKRLQGHKRLCQARLRGKLDEEIVLGKIYEEYRKLPCASKQRYDYTVAKNKWVRNKDKERDRLINVANRTMELITGRDYLGHNLSPGNRHRKLDDANKRDKLYVRLRQVHNRNRRNPGVIVDA